MITEYWLQKKTIGGWSHVTWYSTAEEARKNYDIVAVPNNGYSWRISMVTVIAERLLEEVVKVEAPEIEQKLTSWGAPINKKPSPIASDGWGATGTVSNGWNSTPIHPIKNEPPSEHGLTGSVWVINHQTREKSRVPANELDNYLAKGYVKGGPRTQFQ